MYPSTILLIETDERLQSTAGVPDRRVGPTAFPPLPVPRERAGVRAPVPLPPTPPLPHYCPPFPRRLPAPSKKLAHLRRRPPPLPPSHSTPPSAAPTRRRMPPAAPPAHPAAPPPPE